MKKYIFLFFVLSLYYGCDKDKPSADPVPPEEKSCLTPFFDTKIKRLKEKVPIDTNYYVKGVFNGVPRTTNYYCLEDHSFDKNNIRNHKFLSQFIVHVCDSFYMGFTFLRLSYPYDLIQDKVRFSYYVDHGVTLFFVDNLQKYSDTNNNFYRESYFPFFPPGEFTSIHNYVIVEKISKDSIIEGSFEMDLVNAENNKMIVKDGKFRFKARPNSCSD